MDAQPDDTGDDPVIVTGLGHVIRPPGPGAAVDCDPLPYLKVKKLRKYMGLQDDLAVIATGKALASAGLAQAGEAEAADQSRLSLRERTPFFGAKDDNAATGVGSIVSAERTGLYLVVGCIPFEQADIEPLLAGSVAGEGEERRFSLERFSTSGFRAVNGLLTFRCLPNMPAFHISANFDVQGPYFVTYPGPGQFYLALEEACAALACGTVDVALVGATAHQNNLLVTYHFSRLEYPIAVEHLLDGAGCLVLERASHAQARGAAVRARLLEFNVTYQSFDPFEAPPAPRERFESAVIVPRELGPASLSVALNLNAQFGAGELKHDLETRDGLHAFSRWELA